MSGVILWAVSAALKRTGRDGRVAAFLYEDGNWTVDADGSRCLFVNLGEVDGVYTASSQSLVMASLKLLFRVLMDHKSE